MRTARTASLVSTLLIAASAAACSSGGRIEPGPDSLGDRLAGQQYVALGDSYTAAPGIGRTVGDRGCFRSDNDYPQLVAAETGASLVDRSCVGANTRAIDGPQTTLLGNTVPAQDAALDDDTDLVTIGIGANDFTLYNLISTVCPALALKDPTGSPCTRANAHGAVSLQALLRILERRLEHVVRLVRRRAPGALVLLVGYPSVVPAKGTCEQLPLATGDYPFARSVIVGLDRVMSQAATATDVRYVDTAGPTEGHDICGAEPWIAGRTVQGRGAAWHPYAPEQQEVARLIVKALGPG